MKRFSTSLVVLVIVLCCAGVADAHPGYGWHGDDKGNGELVLEYDLARDLAVSVDKSSGIDPVTNQSLKQLLKLAGFSSKAVPIVGWIYQGLNGLMWASKKQMLLETSTPNYEAYGFKMKKWVPYLVKKYSYADYTLLQEKGDAAVYVVIADAIFWVPKASYFKKDYKRVKAVPKGRLKGWYKYPKTGVLLKEENNATVHLIAVAAINPQYTWVSSSNQLGTVRRAITKDAFNRLRYSWSNVLTVPDGAFDKPNPYLPRGYDIR